MVVSKASDHIAQSILSQAWPAETASVIFAEKVLHKPLHLRPTSPDPTSHDARSKRRLLRLRKKDHTHRRQKPKPLSAKEKRISGLYDIPKDARKYDIYVPLHRMWVGYMREILGLKEGEEGYVNAQGVGSKLASADFHGAKVTVVMSKCVGMVGMTGIVVRDTKFTFQVVTMKNELKTIPKRHTIFQFEIPQRDDGTTELNVVTQDVKAAQCSAQLKNLVFELHGSQFENRATDRATKKFKQRNMTDL